MNAMELKIPPPLVWLVCAAAAWLSAHYLPARALDMAALRWLVWPLLLCGVLLALPAPALFVRARTTMHPRAPERSSHLVTGGVYRFSRNPMYLALALLLLAWVLWLGNGVGLVWPALFAAYLTRFQIVPEERALAAKFGQEYAQYCRRVRRWF